MFKMVHSLSSTKVPPQYWLFLLSFLIAVYMLTDSLKFAIVIYCKLSYLSLSLFLYWLHLWITKYFHYRKKKRIRRNLVPFIKIQAPVMLVQLLVGSLAFVTGLPDKLFLMSGCWMCFSPSPTRTHLVVASVHEAPQDHQQVPGERQGGQHPHAHPQHAVCH